MAGDEPRRSVRATRGQHSKIDLEQAVATKQTKPTKKSKKTPKAQEKQDDNGELRCICGATEENREDDQPWIACDTCDVWQHNVCMGISEYTEEQPNEYFCERCKPEAHKDLLDAISRGEKPWTELHEQYLIRKKEEAEKKTKGKKKGKKGKRSSDTQSRKSKGAEDTPANTPEPKAEPQIEAKDPTPAPRRFEPKAESKQSKKDKDKGKEKEPDTEKEKDEKPKAQEKEIREEKEKEKENEGEMDMEMEMEVDEQGRETDVEKEQIQAIEKERAKEKPSEKAKDLEAEGKKEKMEVRPAQKEKPHSKSAKGQKRSQDSDVKGPESKLRKGPEGQPLPTSPVDSAAPAILALPDDRQGPAKVLTKTLIHSIRSSSAVKLDGASSQARAEQLAVAIETAVFNSHPNHNSYATQCRTLSHNLKHNQDLCDRLLKEELTPTALSTMTSKEMQTKEQQQKDAEILARATKQATLSDGPSGPRIRRTHKGEEIVGDNDVVMEDVSSSSTNFRRLGVTEKERERQKEGPALHIDTQQHSRKGSSDFDFKKVMSSVSPTHSNPYRRPSQPVGGPVDDPDVDRMLGGESPPYSPQAESDPDKIWEGKITMQTLADYIAVAKWAAGYKINEASGLRWDHIIPHEMAVGGRIESLAANEYLCSLRYGSKLDVSVVTITPTYPEGKDQHQAILDYLLGKQRFAVVPNRPIIKCPLKVIDFYLVPCSGGQGNEPEFLLNLEDCIIPKNRPEPLLLGVFVIERDLSRVPKDDVASRSPANTLTQPGLNGAPAASVGQHGQQESTSNGKVSPATQPLDVTRKDTPDQTVLERQRQIQMEAENQRQAQIEGERLAAEVLGTALYDTPTLKFLLPMAHRMCRTEWEVVKEIYENEPRAREDITQLNMAIEKRAKDGPDPSSQPPAQAS